MSPKPPLMTIGLPVYNGERYLAQAIDSILAQDHTDFELVICDNASTDATEEISQSYKKADDRVRIIRHPENLGATRNFNYVFEASEGTYFKWCACDDLIEPSFLRKTLALLEATPEASLAHSHTRIFNDAGEDLETFVPIFEMPQDDPVERMRQIFLHGQRCYEVFGLFRRSTLENTRLISNGKGGDNALLFRLAMLGTFAIVPEPLFLLRRHEEQSTAMVTNSQAYDSWFTGRERKFSFPDWRYLRETWAAPKGITLTPADRIRCYSALLTETYSRRRRLVQNLRVAGETLVFGNSDPARRRRLFAGRS